MSLNRNTDTVSLFRKNNLLSQMKKSWHIYKLLNLKNNNDEKRDRRSKNYNFYRTRKVVSLWFWILKSKIK